MGPVTTTVEAALGGFSVTMFCGIVVLIVSAVAVLVSGGVVLGFLKAWKRIHTSMVSENWFVVKRPTKTAEKRETVTAIKKVAAASK